MLKEAERKKKPCWTFTKENKQQIKQLKTDSFKDKTN